MTRQHGTPSSYPGPSVLLILQLIALPVVTIENQGPAHAQSFQLVLAVYLDTLSFELCQLWVVATGSLVSQTFQPQRSHVTQLGECVAGDEVDHGDPNELSH